MSISETADRGETFEELLLGAVGEARPHFRIRPRGRLVVWLSASALTAGGLAGGLLAALVGASAPATLVAILAYAAAWVLLITLSGVHAHRGDRPWSSVPRRAGRTIFVGLALSWPTAGVLVLLGSQDAVLASIASASAAAFVSIAAAVAIEGCVHRARGRQRTLIIGSGAVAAHVVERLAHSAHLRLEPIGLIDDDVHAERSPALPLLGRLEQLEHVVRTHRVDRVIVAFTRSGHNELLRCIRVCWEQGVAIDVVPRLFEFLDGARAVDRVGGLPLLSITAPALPPSARAIKRATDVLVSAAALVLASPLLLAIALLIKLDSPGPVLFCQVRVGRDGRRFRICKYRSMYLDAEARKQECVALNEAGDGVMFKIREDPRVTRVGRHLRRLSLDELPQLVNVLRGEMSLVGPRPLIAAEAQAISERWHGRRLDLRPGMTGLW